MLLESLQLEFLITQVILAYGKTSCKHYRHAFSVMSKDVLYAFPITWKFYQLIKSMLFSRSVVSLCDPMDCSPPDSSVHGFSRQEYWSGLPFPTPGDLPKPGIELESLMSPALAGGFLITCATSNDPPLPSRYS